MIKIATMRRWKALARECEQLRGDLAHAEAGAQQARRDAAAARAELDATQQTLTRREEEAAELVSEVRVLEEQARQPAKVYLLFCYEQVRSVHPTLEAAKQAAAAEGASRDGWYEAASGKPAFSSTWSISAYYVLSAAPAVGGAA